MSNRVNVIDIPDFAALERGRIARETSVKTAAKEIPKEEKKQKDLYKEDKDGYRTPDSPLPPGSLDWLRARVPVAKIGYSIYVYDLRKQEPL